ncbi:hypothetical protein [Novosphingobium terrae]|uniref:hypothetical protein n=1 Tax=Novosphingobium terrae TaxID=2726189 RepID=UPI00197EF28C|nr:hypothetical protein [Novosphingobium terrae]
MDLLPALDPQNMAKVAMSPQRHRRCLFSSTIVDLKRDATLRVFHATIAYDAAMMQTILVARCGPRLASLACTMNGFDPSDPIAIAMVN